MQISSTNLTELLKFQLIAIGNDMTADVYKGEDNSVIHQILRATFWDVVSWLCIAERGFLGHESNYLVFYGTRRVNAMFTRTRH
jgi:hypothetical protein